MRKTARKPKHTIPVEPPVEVAPMADSTTGQTPAPPAVMSAPPTSAPIDETLLGDLEAILLTADRPASSSRLSEAIGLGADDGALRIGQMVELLNTQYEQTGRAYRIEKVAGGVRLMTLPGHADAIAAYHKLGASARLSRAAIETLSIIAYRQPMTRAQIEAIRGVGAGEVLRSLLERRLVAIIGRAEEVGRPILYGTSRAFLEEFGLATLKDLPPVESSSHKDKPSGTGMGAGAKKASVKEEPVASPAPSDTPEE